MFSFRRKPKKLEEPPPIRTSPSLPDLKSTVQAIPWPEELVDVAAIRKVDTDDDIDSVAAITEESHVVGGEGVVGRPSVVSARHQGAARISFSRGREPVMFHKPFSRTSLVSSTRVPTPGFASSSTGEAPTSADGTKAPISSFYMSMATPPEALEKLRKQRYERREKSESTTGSRIGQRRAKVPPTFNIMVAGGKGTGKTSLLRLLLETAEVSPSVTQEQRVALDKFLNDSTKSTNAIQSTSIEILETKFDRVMLSVIDTPGLDFQEGRELRLDRQVSAILKYVDAQYADTMSEESKVIRKQKGDQHIHLCIYMIDPASIISADARRTPHPTLHLSPAKTRSEATISHSHPPELVPDTSSGDDSGDESDGEDGLLTMAPAEIKVIRRISKRSNVLPVIAHADSLTDEKLEAIKEAIRKGLTEAGIDFGVFGPLTRHAPSEDKSEKRSTRFANGVNGSTSGHTENDDDTLTAEGTDEEYANGESEDRQSRPVIKLRPSRHRNISRSRSRRRDLSRVAEDDRQPLVPDASDIDSVANIRFSAHILAKNDISSLLPFALITPENKKRPRRQKQASVVDSPATPTGTSHTSGPATEDGHDLQNSHVTDNTMSNVSTQANGSPTSHPFLQGPPADMKGVFIRRFRWGTVDVLDPTHCDFAALRTAILSTHLKVLKVHTREVLYEKYRTEKLLARRATRNISEEERNRLLQDLGI